jgi:uncharacterized membrane protein (DUF485 family)
MAGLQILDPSAGYGITIGIGLAFAVVMVGFTLVGIYLYHRSSLANFRIYSKSIWSS